MIKNLSQFKKWVAKGKEIQFLENAIKPDMGNGQIRKINKVQTTSFTTLVNDEDSWLDYPKAKECNFNHDGTIDIYRHGRFFLKIKPVINESRR